MLYSQHPIISLPPDQMLADNRGWRVNEGGCESKAMGFRFDALMADSASGG